MSSVIWTIFAILRLFEPKNEMAVSVPVPTMDRGEGYSHFEDLLSYNNQQIIE